MTNLETLLLAMLGNKGGGGEGGTTNYNELDNKPSINGVELIRNKSAEDLGLASKDDLSAAVESTISDNLIPFPYYNASGTISGNLVHTVMDDGTIHVVGESTSRSTFFLARNKVDMLEDGKTYCFSLNATGTGKLRSVYVGMNGGSAQSHVVVRELEAPLNESIIIAYQRQEGWTSDTVAVSIEAGETVDLYLKLMIEEGTVSHLYQPYKYSRKSLEERITVLENALIDIASLMEE